jgi:hypothetical protein
LVCEGVIVDDRVPELEPVVEGVIVFVAVREMVGVIEEVTDQVGVVEGPDPGPTCNKQEAVVTLDILEGNVTPT